jgi:hypothetical protein
VKRRLALLLLPRFVSPGVPFAQEEPDREETDRELTDDHVEDVDEQATLFPIPDYSTDFFSRAALSGDWSGERIVLAEHGIQFAVDVNQFYQGVMDGGANERDDYNGSAEDRVHGLPPWIDCPLSSTSFR